MCPCEALLLMDERERERERERESESMSNSLKSDLFQDKKDHPWWLGLSYKGIAVYDKTDKTTPRKVNNNKHPGNHPPSYYIAVPDSIDTTVH